MKTECFIYKKYLLREYFDKFINAVSNTYCGGVIDFTAIQYLLWGYCDENWMIYKVFTKGSELGWEFILYYLFLG